MSHPFLYFPASPFAGDNEKISNTDRANVLTITMFSVASWNIRFSWEQHPNSRIAGNMFFELASILRVSARHMIYDAVRRGLYQQAGICK